MRDNKHEMFASPYEAQAAAQDRVFLATVRGGVRLGWRMALLTAVYLGVGQTLTVVRNRVNPLDYGVSGAVMGAAWKAPSLGPKGAVAGGLLFL